MVGCRFLKKPLNDNSGRLTKAERKAFNAWLDKKRNNRTIEMLKITIEPIIELGELIGTIKKVKLFGLTLMTKVLMYPSARVLKDKEWHYYHEI